jgi:nucleoside-diphosphate-sugar epimerase
MKVVVTGANGFVGLHTVRGLLDAGYNVLAVDIIDSEYKHTR